MRRYKVEKIDGKMVVTPSRTGRYRSKEPSEIEMVLSELNYTPKTAEVLIGKTWYPLGKNRLSRSIKKIKPRYTLAPITKRRPLYLRVLAKLHLYKDPLDVLIYRKPKE